MPTVTALKSLIQPQIAPGNDAEFLCILQEVEIRLTEWCKFQWSRAKVTLHPVNGIVTLPSIFASILGAQVDGYARDIRSVDFEFTPGGVGEISVEGTASTILVDQGMSDLGVRTYKVSGNLEDTATIVCLVHKAPATLYDPDLADEDLPADATDVVTCPTVGAIKNAAMAIVQEEQNEPEQSQKYMSIALSILNGTEKSQRGGARQMMNIRPNGPGFSPLRNLR